MCRDFGRSRCHRTGAPGQATHTRIPPQLHSARYNPATIFQLNHSPQTTPSGVRSQLLEVVTDAAVALGFEPAVHFAGLLEETLTGDVVADAVAVLREDLSNVARHAHARSVEVRVTATPQRVSVEVHDDGNGMSDTHRRSGLANLRHRAERRGGAFTLTARDPRGTVLQWWIPAP